MILHFAVVPPTLLKFSIEWYNTATYPVLIQEVIVDKAEVLRSIGTIKTYLEGIQFILENDPELKENEGGVANFANQLISHLPDEVGAIRINGKVYGVEDASVIWTLDDVNDHLSTLMQEVGLYLKDVSDSWL